MVGHIVLLTFVMLLAGVFGGLINFHLAQQRDPEHTNLARCIVIGIGAAFLVPVILDMLSSDLIVASSSEPSKMLIFIGFCLIAAVGSKFATGSINERTLKEVRSAAKRAEELRQEIINIQAEVSPLIDTETEIDPNNDSHPALSSEDTDLLDVTSTSVLKTLDSGRYIFRSLQGICHETNHDEATVTKTLTVLLSRDLIGKTSGPKGVRWYVTEKGRRALKLPQQ